jgi:hypothetical protein
MEKKRLVISYDKLTPDLLNALRKKYPNGYEDHVFKVNAPNKEFYAVTLDTEDASYLVKVNVKIDSSMNDFDNDAEDDNGKDSFGTPDDDFDNIADEDQEDD